MELYNITELCEMVRITRRTAYNWIENQIIPPQAIVSRLGNGSKILIDGRIIRHTRTNHPKVKTIQKIMQMRYDKGKNAVA